MTTNLQNNDSIKPSSESLRRSETTIKYVGWSERLRRDRFLINLQLPRSWFYKKS